MKTIEIQAKPFFEILKLKDTSMWEIFSQMIDGEKKILQFLDEENNELFTYLLPENIVQLENDRKIFAKEYAEKLKTYN